jgi:hypothetical protein
MSLSENAFELKLSHDGRGMLIAVGAIRRLTAMTTIARNLRRRFPTIAGMILFSASTCIVSAAEMVDPGRQGDMFKRIFSYDKDLRDAEKIVVIVVGESRRGPEIDEIAAVFREKGLFPAVVLAADLSDDLTSTLTPQSAVMYVMPESPTTP